MKGKVIKWLLVFMIIYMVSCCQRQQTDMGYYECEVFTNNCSQFRLIQCRKQYCAEQRRYTDYECHWRDGRQYCNNVERYQCVRYDYYYYDNQTCFQNCCGQIQNQLGVWNQQTLQSCSIENQRLVAQRNKLIGIIVGSVLGGIALIVIIIVSCCCYKKGKCDNCCPGQQTAKQYHQRQQPNQVYGGSQKNYQNNNYGNNNYENNNYGNNYDNNNYQNNNNYGNNNWGNNYDNNNYGNNNFGNNNFGNNNYGNNYGNNNYNNNNYGSNNQFGP